MAPSDSAPLRRVRELLARRVEETSLRRTAREVGMSPSGLRKLLDGGDPYSATRRKLERWYVREAAAPYGPDAEEAARAAISVVVDLLPPSRRRKATAEIAGVLAREHERAGLAVPDWIHELRPGRRAGE